MKWALVLIVAGTIGALADSPKAIATDRRNFLIKVGIMEPAGEHRDRLRETRDITMDPSRRPGFCILVDPPDKKPYDVVTVHHLPGVPKRLTGKLEGQNPTEAEAGFRVPAERGSGIRPLCFDFHVGDPLGEYRIEVIVNGALTETLRLKVTAAIPKK